MVSTSAFIEIEAPDADKLAGSGVTIFGTDPGELRQVGALRGVYLTVFRQSDGTQYHYEATVMQSGLMPSYNSAASGLSFSARRYAFRLGQRFPLLLPLIPVAADVLRDATYFVTIQLQKYLPGIQAFDPPLRTDAWEPASSFSPLLERLNPEQRDALFRGKAPIVRVPAARNAIVPRQAELDERRLIEGHRLIVRKLIRRQPPDDK
jgi:hypothetical protein